MECEVLLDKGIYSFLISFHSGSERHVEHRWLTRPTVCDIVAGMWLSMHG